MRWTKYIGFSMFERVIEDVTAIDCYTSLERCKRSVLDAIGIALGISEQKIKRLTRANLVMQITNHLIIYGRL